MTNFIIRFLDRIAENNDFHDGLLYGIFLGIGMTFLAFLLGYLFPVF